MCTAAPGRCRCQHIGGDGGGGGDGNTDPGSISIFAHTNRSLYNVDPDTLAITKVGDFNTNVTIFDTGEMTDIAIDRAGKMIGVTFMAVYRVDPTTAQVTMLSGSLANTFNGLSFVPADTIGMTGDDVLIGTRDTDGLVFRVDPMTGAATQVGNMGSGISSSGDLVGVVGLGTLQTIKGSGNDRLARLAPNTFAATPIGTDVGFTKVWGVGFWKDTIYGFSELGQFIKIDPTTGAGTLVQTGGPAWWGAAVTTVAPVLL